MAPAAPDSLPDPFHTLAALCRQPPDPGGVAAPPAHGLLCQLALANYLDHWWVHARLPIMHQALVAGATMADVAAATGAREHTVAQNWLLFATGRAAGHAGAVRGEPTITPRQIQQIMDRHRHLWPEGRRG